MYLNLKLQIFKLGLHQNRLAKELGIDETVLSKIIHGYREPSERQKQSISNYLGANEQWLFEKYEGVSHPSPPTLAQRRDYGDS